MKMMNMNIMNMMMKKLKRKRKRNIQLKLMIMLKIISRQVNNHHYTKKIFKIDQILYSELYIYIF